MSNFVKLYASILDSTIWAEPAPTVKVFITMLAMADANGFVEGSLTGVMRRSIVSREECEEALRVLTAPDPDSKTSDHEGRRIEKVDGGWIVLNYLKYREMRSEAQIAAAERVKRHRAKQKALHVTPVTVVTHRNGKSRDVRTDVEVDVEEEKETAKSKTKTKATGEPSPFAKTVCDALYEAWSSKRGVIQYSAFRKAFSPLFPAAGARFSQKQLEDAIEVYAEWVDGLSPRDAGFETVYRFVGDIARWVRLGAMPAIDPETRMPTERGQLA